MKMQKTIWILSQFCLCLSVRKCNHCSVTDGDFHRKPFANFLIHCSAKRGIEVVLSFSEKPYTTFTSSCYSDRADGCFHHVLRKQLWIPCDESHCLGEAKNIGQTSWGHPKIRILLQEWLNRKPSKVGWGELFPAIGTVFALTHSSFSGLTLTFFLDGMWSSEAHDCNTWLFINTRELNSYPALQRNIF